jgi:hypothetical protein
MQLVGQLADAEQPTDKDGHIDSMTAPAGDRSGAGIGWL